ncbi:glycoside hydrolase family 18 [Porphyromonas pogonae]|uniref:glycoside hydrolase family 18 n=1 Tax=Porphyromonas pogonae TaxID=867595 RepID=UPI002E777BE1|nr:glycoside hydrolase family 18 [Porphyromonas pogonae]
MKNLNIISSFLITACTLLTSCSKWTETEIKEPLSLVGTNKSEAYYKQLREYKKTDHAVAFGWFGNWTGTGSSLQGSLAGLPDSVDFVSLWGGWKNPTAEQIKDLRFVQEVKGTKALACGLIFDIGDQITPAMPKEMEKAGKTWEEWRYEYWGWSTANDEEGLKKRQAAVIKYANAICDTVYKYGYDGFDIDAEPSYAQPFQTKKELWELNKSEKDRTLMPLFVETLAKRIGPMAQDEAGRKKLLVIDGEPEAVPAKYGKYFNYFILQAYDDGSQPSKSRFSSQIDHFKSVLSVEDICKKVIITVNFESHAQTGGRPMGQIMTYAQYNPVINGVTYRKGGVGSYHMEYEYLATPADNVAGIDMRDMKGATYPWLRKSIQLMNPVIK